MIGDVTLIGLAFQTGMTLMSILVAVTERKPVWTLRLFGLTAVTWGFWMIWILRAALCRGDACCQSGLWLCQ